MNTPMRALEASENYQNFQRLLVGHYCDQSLRSFKAGKQIPLDTKSVWIIYSGYVQVSTLQASGDESVLGFLCPLMPLSLRLSFLETYEATALTDVELLQLSQDDINRSPELLHEIYLQTIRCLRQAEALLWIAGKRAMIDRLRGFLDLLAHEFGQSTTDGVRIDFRLRHQQIANAVGTTRVTATRFLRELREQGVFHVGKDKHIYLHEVSESCLIPVSSS
jgi:CRP-like cAMP-binding protein